LLGENVSINHEKVTKIDVVVNPTLNNMQTPKNGEEIHLRDDNSSAVGGQALITE